MSKDYLHSLFNLEGQVAVVIGGTGVLGGALCEGLAQAGAFVVVPRWSGARTTTAGSSVAPLRFGAFWGRGGSSGHR